MTTWSELVAVALVGTERRPVAVALDELDGVVLGSPEAAVLAGAAVLGAARSAGFVPAATSPPRGAPAPLDDRPPAPPTAVQLLELLLAGDVRVPGGASPLVADWLERCAAAGHRLPPRLVPRVLELGTSEEDLRKAALDAVGALGPWLGRRNPAWAWASTDPAAPPAGDGPAEWATGSRSGRMEVLDRLRATDPGAARVLLREAWGTEAAADREAMLAALAVGLSPDDEPLLEAALDDRAKGVRARAAQLLDSLPTSARAQRMAARAGALVRVGGRLRKGLLVELPAEPDEAARRDGVTGDRITGLGVAASRLVQVVAATPLAMWPHHLGQDVEWIVDRGREHQELLLGWSRAAVNQRDSRWAMALLRHVARPELLASLPPVVAAEWLERSFPRLQEPSLFPMVAAVPGGWLAPLSAAVVARYAELAEKAPLIDLVAPLLVRRLDPSVAPDVERWAGRLPEGSRDRRTVRNLHHALTVRRSIAEELS